MDLDMPAMAREFAESLGKAGVPLDFTPASLAHIDSLIASLVKNLPPATAPEGKHKRAMACSVRWRSPPPARGCVGDG